MTEGVKKTDPFGSVFFYAKNRKRPPDGGPYLLLFLPSNPEGWTNELTLLDKHAVPTLVCHHGTDNKADAGYQTDHTGAGAGDVGDQRPEAADGQSGTRESHDDRHKTQTPFQTEILILFAYQYKGEGCKLCVQHRDFVKRNDS